MGIKNLNVILDNAPAIGYSPGATLRGRILITANDRIRIRSLGLKIDGEAQVNFSDTVTRRRRRWRRRAGDTGTSGTVIQDTTQDVEWFRSDESYFTTSYQILGESEISVGEQEYLFTAVLPAVLPSTFSGRHGFIRYTLKVKLDKAWNFDQVAKVEFRVAMPKDLNMLQLVSVGGQTLHNLSESVVYRGVKHFNCLCCKSGPLSLVLQVARSGLVPGETLTLTVEVDNATNVNITHFNIILRQEALWLARYPRTNSKTTHEDLAVLKCTGVAQRNNRSWYQPFSIPAMPSVNIDACSIIKLHHYIIVEAVPEGMHTNLTVSAPIVIGTVPLGVPATPQLGFSPFSATNPGFIAPEVGFVQPFLAQPQPSAPMSEFEHPEPPPPYPVTPPIQQDEPPRKY